MKGFDGVVKYFLLVFPEDVLFVMLSRILSTILTR